jgi:hypothetical protein
MPHTSFIWIEGSAFGDPRDTESDKCNGFSPEDKIRIGMGGKQEIEK